MNVNGLNSLVRRMGAHGVMEKHNTKYFLNHDFYNFCLNANPDGSSIEITKKDLKALFLNDVLIHYPVYDTDLEDLLNKKNNLLTQLTLELQEVRLKKKFNILIDKIKEYRKVRLNGQMLGFALYFLEQYIKNRSYLDISRFESEFSQLRNITGSKKIQAKAIAFRRSCFEIDGKFNEIGTISTTLEKKLIKDYPWIIENKLTIYQIISRITWINGIPEKEAVDILLSWKLISKEDSKLFLQKNQISYRFAELGFRKYISIQMFRAMPQIIIDLDPYDGN